MNRWTCPPTLPPHLSRQQHPRLLAGRCVVLRATCVPLYVPSASKH